ncbi:hypothetical protein ACJDT4_13210 [Clostridium neuense]|uniref:Uncharacterized protein n=1 Tax=Clostridium neuense TaxID=1728934 RepID=A0ABW8TFU6_9CLOT
MKNISTMRGIKEGRKYILENYGFDIKWIIKRLASCCPVFVLSIVKLGTLNLYKVQFKDKINCYEMLYCTEDDKIVYLVEF